MVERSGTRRAVFYVRIRDPRLLELIEFYAEDIRSLERLGFEVFRTNSIWAAVRARGDVLVAWWWHSAFPVVLASRLRGRPVVVTGASGFAEPVNTGPVREMLRMVLIRATTRLATVNVSISEAESAKLRSIDAPRLRCVPCAVDSSYFSPGEKDVAPTAVIVSQLFYISMRRKGVDTAIRAVQTIRKAVPDFRLLVAGPIAADGQDYLDKLADEVDFTGIEVLGEVTRERKRMLLAGAWCALQPSLYEGFGVSVLEAMACGTVPVVSNAGALPELVATAGLSVEPGDPLALAAAVVALLTDPEQRATLSEKARARATAFDSARHDQQWGEVLREAGVGHPNADAFVPEPGRDTDHFTSVAPHWAARYGTRPSFQARLEYVCRILLPAIGRVDAARVLDLGSGAGVFSAVASATAGWVVAADPSAPMIAAAIESRSELEVLLRARAVVPRFERISNVRATADAFVRGRGKFDVILLISVLEYLAEARDLLEKISALLSSDGVLIATIPRSASPIRILEGPANKIFMVLGRLFPVDRLRERSYETLLVRRSSKAWRTLLRESGFEVVDEVGIPLGLHWPLRAFAPNAALTLRKRVTP